MRNVECGMRNDKKSMKFRIPHSEFRIWQRPMGPPLPAEAGRSLPEKGSPNRCFLRATPLTPGHDKGYLQSEWGGRPFLSLPLGRFSRGIPVEKAEPEIFLVLIQEDEPGSELLLEEMALVPEEAGEEIVWA